MVLRVVKQMDAKRKGGRERRREGERKKGRKATVKLGKAYGFH